MKVNEIFNKKRIIAFVMAFAMVATLLSGVSFASQAADVEKTPVYSFYNAQNGDHVYCIGDDIQKAISFGLNNENVSWYAPTVSLTPVYRIYNPNTGEHLFTRDKEAGQKAVDAGWQWDNNGEPYLYSNDDEDSQVAVYRFYHSGVTNASSHVYKSEEQTDDIAKLIEMGYVLEEGETIYGVGDASQVVALTDLNGLQADGTALTTDTLQIVFGSAFGTPKSVAWYKDGAVIQVVVENIKATDLQFNPAIAETGTGTYYAVVENTKGQSFTSNSIDVVEEGVAVLSDFTISDPYETGTVDLKAQSALSVVDVTLNKNYEGTFYLVNSEYDEYEDLDNTGFAPVEREDNQGNTVTVTKSSQFTNANLQKSYLDTETEVKALRYKDSDNQVHYKILTAIEDKDEAVTRGDDYYLVFDQDGDVTDNTTRADWNTTDDYTVPYVLAPTSIKVTDAKATVKTAGWSAQLYFGEDTADYMNAVYIGAPINYNEDELQMHLYRSADTDFKTKTSFNADLDITDENAGNMYKGKAYSAVDWTKTPAETTDSTAKVTDDTDDSWVFATFTAEAGIFGEDELVLASDAQSVLPMVGTATLAESTKDAGDINVTLNNLKGSATIALVTSGVKGTITEYPEMTGAQNKALLANAQAGNFVAVTRASKGQASVTFDDVLSNINDTEHGDLYGVVILPDNTEDYATGYGFGAVSQVQTDFELDEVAYTAGTTAITCLDQFGNEMKTPTAITKRSMTGITTVADVAATKFAMAETGKVTLTAGGADGKKDTVGDIWSIQLTKNKTFYAKVTNVTDNAADAWTVWVE